MALAEEASAERETEELAAEMGSQFRSPETLAYSLLAAKTRLGWSLHEFLAEELGYEAGCPDTLPVLGAGLCWMRAQEPRSNAAGF